jgi:hypothetical protein
MMGAKRRADADAEPECGQTEMLPHTPQHPPLEFETEAQLSQ